MSTQTGTGDQLVTVGPWLPVVNPDMFGHRCAWCGAKRVKGRRVKRIEGGYGYA
jgi:hypothetical protein